MDNVETNKGVDSSDGVNYSIGVNHSDGVNSSDGVNWSRGVNSSDGVNSSRGVDWSRGVNSSDGVDSSDGVNSSYGILNSFGVDRAIFLADKKRSCSIFGKEVSEERFNEVWEELYNKLDDWFPKFNNAFELLNKHGDWSKVPISEISSTLNDWEEPYEAWKDMPKEAIEYVKSLPEFDADMFKRITGIATEKKSETIIIEGKEYTLDEIKKALVNILSNTL